MDPNMGRGRCRGRPQIQQERPADSPGAPMQPAPHGRPLDPAEIVRPGPAGVAALPGEGAFEGVGRARGRSTWARDGSAGRQPAVGGAVSQVTEGIGQLKMPGDDDDRSSGSSSSDKNPLLWTKPRTVSVKQGAAGKIIPLFSNYFSLTRMVNTKTCLYHVYISPEEDRTPVRKKLLAQHREKLGAYIFDGMKLLLSHKLPSDVTELVSRLEEGDQVFQLQLKFSKEMDLLDSEYVHLMNILLRRCLEILGLQLLGRNYFNPNAEIRDEKNKIAIWPGYTTTIRQHESSLLLGVDVSHKFLRTDTAYSVLKRGPNQKEAAMNNLLGAIVVTKYNNRTYRIDEISWGYNPMCKFPYRGSTITYLQYYESKYQLKIRDPGQPLLLSRPKKKDLRRGAGDIYLIPELCIMTGLSEEMRADFNMMKDLADYLRTAPDKRVRSVMTLSRDLIANEQAKIQMSDWGLKLSNKLVELNGRVLPEEVIFQGEQKIRYDRNKADWSREVRSVRLNVAINVQRWAIVFPSRQRDQSRELCNTLQRVGPPMGMQFATPKVFALESTSVQDCIDSLKSCEGMQLVVVVLPSNRLDYYSAVKRCLAATMGIPSQCVVSRTLSKKQGLMSIATKIAIQINCKLGGEPWSVQIPLKNTMIIGYDAYHEKGSHNASYGAVVSSLNQSFSRYLSQAATHHNHEELSNNFALGVRNALQRYKSENGEFPVRVLVYRDGVGDGQIGYVRDHEIAEIQRCFEMFKTKPEFAFIIVSKKINTRLFTRGGDRGASVGNPPPGTVADDIITLPERYDFYLVPQKTNIGTVSPTSFNIIADTTGLKPDHMQRLAFKLTHLYYNWQGTVRVPAPCMYAHKLAFMMGQVVNKTPHPNLTTSLWYL